MPRTEEANQRIREAQRAKILDGALKVFARKGLTATMADIATAAGVSQGLAYRYFANKETLLSALLEQTMQTSSQGLQRILEMPGSPGERLTFLISRIIESRREHPELYQLLYPDFNREEVPDHLRDSINRQGLAFMGMLRQLIIEGQATGEIVEDDPDKLVIATLAYLDGLTRWAMYDPEWMREHFPDANIFLRMFKPASGKAAES
jgi:AcrR family transcriptional regulator